LLPLHVALNGQRFPQVPQLRGSVAVLVQVLFVPHVTPPGHVHLLAAHTPPDPHEVPQVPQLAASDVVSTHLPLHTV
jgi:hypothetical protein